MLNAYLAELERELARRLPPEDVQARLAEADAHLRDGIEARVELGFDPWEAERETIEAFGLSHQIAKAEPVPSAWLRVRLLAAGFAVGASVVAALLPVVWSWRYGIEAVFATWIGIGIAFAAAAYRARRPALLPIALTGLTGALAVWLASATWLDLGSEYGKVPRGMLGRLADEQRQAIAQRRADQNAFEEGLRIFRARGVQAFRVAGIYRAPLWQARWTPQDRLEYGYYDDPRRAQRAWLAAAKGARPAFDSQRIDSMLVALSHAKSDPLENLCHFGPVLLPANLGVAAFAVVLDLGAAGLGALVFHLRRRPKGGVLRA